jgi:Trk K+ transport system NAD-binding subunit
MPALRLEQIEVRWRRWRRLRFRLWREWCFLRTVARHVRWRLLVVALILACGALLFMRFEKREKLDFLRATYYTWSLVFGESPEAFPESIPLQVMFFIMPILGMTVILEAIVDFAFLLRDRRRYERNWCLTMSASLSNHVILVGFGKLGYRIFGLLRRLGEPVVVIEQDERNRFLDVVRRDGSPLLVGDARDERLLEEANIAKAASVILATNDDLANLEVALDARRLKPGIRVVCRVFDQNMADKIRDGFNIRSAMSQSAMSAPAFAMAAVDPAIVNSFVVGGELIVLHRWTVQPNGPLAARTVGQVMQELSCGVIEWKRPGQPERLFPTAETKLLPGDEVLLQGPYETVTRLRRRAE